MFGGGFGPLYSFIQGLDMSQKTRHNKSKHANKKIDELIKETLKKIREENNESKDL